MNKLSFLLIDDDEIFNFVHRKQIMRFNIEKEIVDYTSPFNALAYLKNISLDKLPDVILLDINMPELNGFEFVERIVKERPEIEGKLNIFVVTSSLNPTDYQQAKKFDCIKGYYNKPIDLEKIMNTVNWIMK
jgi:CheY-like chemotaxis protein